MSHLKERSEKICLNCNAHVYGKYCHICGQENIEPKETFWGLVTHLVYDIIHFDGKFFLSLKYLLFNPGFLSQEYLRGKRASYLHPIRMYVFTSAIFFIIFFTFIIKPGNNSFVKIENKVTPVMQMDSLVKKLDTTPDSAEQRKIQLQIDSIAKSLQTESPRALSDSLNSDDSDKVRGKAGTSLPRIIFDSIPATIEQYDSIQKYLPENKRDGWVRNFATRRSILLKAEYEKDKEGFQERLIEKFLHSMPQMMFVSLPLVALILQLLYVRHRKEFFYVNHVIFLIHVFIAIFILILISDGFAYLYTISHYAIFSWLETITGIARVYYIYKAMRNFYGQGIFKTILKYILLFFTFMVIFILVLVIFFFTSLLQV